MVFPSSQRRGGCAIKKCREATKVAQTGWSERRNVSPNRPPRRFAPPLLCEEGNALHIRYRNYEKQYSIKLAGPGCSRVIDVNNFQVGVEIESRRTLFTFADTGRLHPAERNLGFSSNCRRIHVNHAGLDPFTEIENAAGVIGIDRRSQTIVRSVRK